jgi:hypothetical protein
MKKTTKTVEVKEEAYSYEACHWTCETCGYETDDEDDSKAHYGKEHSFKAKKEAGEYTFLWFATAEDYRAYHQDWDAGVCELSYREDRFKEPGWYGLKTWEEPCRRGCCSNYPTAGIYIRVLYEEQAEMWKEVQKRADAIAKLLETRL